MSHFRLPLKFPVPLWSSFSPESMLLYILVIIPMIPDILAFNFGAHPYPHMTANNQPCRHCPAGYGVSQLCNSTHDTVCAACLPNTFTPGHLHMDVCQSCSECGVGLFVDRKCTVSADTLCDSCLTTHVPHNWDFYRKCLGNHQAKDELLTDDQSADSLLFPRTDNNGDSSDRIIEWELARDEMDLRKELNALKQTVNEELVGLKTLGSAVNHVLDQQSPRQAVSGQTGFPDKSTMYEKNPNTVLAVVLLSTFGALGMASLAGVIILIYVNRQKVKADTGYGGVKTHSDGTSLLTMENSLDSEDAMI